MRKVQNKKVINRLSARTLTAKGKKNLVVIIAIMLTTVLFTALFTIGGSMIQSVQESTMRQVGGKSMAGVKFILPADYEKLAQDPVVKNLSYRIIVGTAENEELLKLNTEVNYAEDEDAKSMFCYPTKGTMPVERLEIATSTLVLDALGIPHELGATVPLDILVGEKHITEEFVLSGYWEGDTVAMAQECWISREYCDEVAPTPEKSFYEELGCEYAGYWMLDFDYANTWDIENKTVALLERNGYDSNVISYGVNWAYATSNVDGETIVFIVVLLSLILASGYLIIYNIFSLNVAGDIKSYGLLKTIGTTEKQLKKLVRRQAAFLSAIGIPCGLILGAIIGKILFPVIVSNFTLGSVVKFYINPLIMVGAAAFSFFTVWVSCNKPCKLAAKVSPIEAVRYTDKSFYTGKKERRTRKVTAFSFGWANVGRNRKKVVVVIASLSLSIILLNSVYVMIQGFDMDKYVSNFILGDALVTDATILNGAGTTKTVDGITGDIQEELEDIEGVEAVHNVYYAYSDIKLSENIYKNFMKFMEENPDYFSNPYAQEEISLFKEEAVIGGQIYGLDQWGSGQLKCYKGEIDWEKFKTGDYCLVNSYGIYNELQEPLSGMYGDVGDKLSMKLSDGTVKEYEVMAIVDMPYAMTSRFFTFLGMQIIVPEQEYLAHAEPRALLSILTKEKDSEVSLDEALENYTKYVRTNLTYTSKQTYEEEYKSFVNMFWIVGGSLSFVLALIGILNFMNAIVTGILARKQELAMMESVGMTGKQMKVMLAWEGIIYIIFTIICSILTTVLLDGLVLKNVIEGFWFATNHFTVLPIVLCIPVLLLAACVIPIAAYKNMTKESVVERLRETE